MKSATDWIQQLNLRPHPEGGHYSEVYRADQSVMTAIGQRSKQTSIYFLLNSGERSKFHRLRSDELWFFHSGGPVEILILTDAGVEIIELGPDAKLQYLIEANCWFAARLKEESPYVLVSCVVVPGFEFKDFELANGLALENDFPEAKDVIREFY